MPARNAFNTHAGCAVFLVAEFDGSRVTHVNGASSDKGAAVIDTDNDAASVIEICDACVARQLHGGVSCREAVHVIDLADCGLFAVKLFAVPACSARLYQGFISRHRVKALPHDGVGAVGPFVGLFRFNDDFIGFMCFKRTRKSWRAVAVIVFAGVGAAGAPGQAKAQQQCQPENMPCGAGGILCFDRCSHRHKNEVRSAEWKNTKKTSENTCHDRA